jgi:TIR domain-containing protein
MCELVRSTHILTTAANDFVDTALIPLYSAEVKLISSFVSYAHSDSADLQKLRTVLDPLFKTSARYQFSNWSDHQILPGEFWRREIEEALKKAQFGLLFLSPQFLASGFISRDELPKLLEKGMIVPVALHAIPFDGTIDLKGLQDRQIFRDSKGRAFEKCRTQTDRRDFALELFGKIHKLLEKYA